MKITDKQIDEGLMKAYKEAGHNAYFGNGFEAGVKFALKQTEDTIKLLEFMIENGLGEEDMKNDITLPTEL